MITKLVCVVALLIGACFFNGLDAIMYGTALSVCAGVMLVESFNKPRPA